MTRTTPNTPIIRNTRRRSLASKKTNQARPDLWVLFNGQVPWSAKRRCAYHDEQDGPPTFARWPLRTFRDGYLHGFAHHVAAKRPHLIAAALVDLGHEVSLPSEQLDDANALQEPQRRTAKERALQFSAPTSRTNATRRNPQPDPNKLHASATSTLTSSTYTLELDILHAMHAFSPASFLPRRTFDRLSES